VADEFGHIQARLDWYNITGRVKRWRQTSLLSFASSYYEMNETGTWDSQAGIRSIKFTPDTGTNFVSGTIIELYGVGKQWVVTAGTLGDVTITNGLLVP
jgi:hypothetical protein